MQVKYTTQKGLHEHFETQLVSTSPDVLLLASPFEAQKRLGGEFRRHCHSIIITLIYHISTTILFAILPEIFTTNKSPLF